MHALGPCGKDGDGSLNVDRHVGDPVKANETMLAQIEPGDPSLLDPRSEAQARQTNFKILINSFYGYLGFSGARFGDGELAAEVTRRGRELLQTLIDEFAKHGINVGEVSVDLAKMLKRKRGIVKQLTDGIAAMLENHPLIAYAFDVVAPPPERARRLLERLSKGAGLRFRPIEMRHFDQELRTIVDIFNDAWSDNCGFVPMTPAEVRYMGKNLKPIVRAEYAWIGEVDGEPAAMTVTLPNINEAIADLHGRLLPFGWLKLLWRLKTGGVMYESLPAVSGNLGFFLSNDGWLRAVQ